MKIKSVTLELPDREIFYQVGSPSYSGEIITEIRKAEKNGEMASVQYYEIYTEKGLSAELHHYSHVIYFMEAPK